MTRPSLLEMTPKELADLVGRMGQPAYRADQLRDWVYDKAVTDPAGMSNLPRGFVDRFEILTSRVAEQAVSRDGTIKLLLELADGEHVETVLIPAGRRATACLSTQAGCGMGCAFCASAVGGLKRNLTAGEMLQQVIHLRQAGRRRVSNVVFMGIGEPLANYDATVAAIRALIDPARFGISARSITVSTVGLPKQIRRLARERLPITLALSLHAPDDVLRRQLIPAARGISLEEILSAAEVFFRSRKREVTLEYILLGGVNDTPRCAESLAKIARRLRCNVNLIRYNPVGALGFSAPSASAVGNFADRLSRRGVNVHVRRPRGQDIAAACGQLRRRQAGGGSSP